MYTYAIVRKILEINKLGKYSNLKVNSKNIDPIPENVVINIDVTNIISKLLFLVAIPFVAMSLMVKKIAAIGIRVSKWIAYHGFSININNELNQYKKIVPCGIEDKGVTNLVKIKNQDYKKLNFILEKNLINFLKN